jgi:hypothetical protein
MLLYVISEAEAPDCCYAHDQRNEVAGVDFVDENGPLPHLDGVLYVAAAHVESDHLKVV